MKFKLVESIDDTRYIRVEILDDSNSVVAGLFRGCNVLLKQLWDEDSPLWDDLNTPLSELEYLTPYPENINDNRTRFAYTETFYNDHIELFEDIQYVLNECAWYMVVNKIHTPTNITYKDDIQVAYVDELYESFLHETYSNIPKMHRAIMDEFGSPTAGPGCIFIAPDGQFVKIYPRLDDHEDLCYWLEENGFDEADIIEDAEWFVDTFGYVRCRDSQWLPLIQCPDNMTPKQFSSLEEWLEEYVEGGVNLEVTCGDQIKRYNTNEYFPEDIIKLIKRYYSSGTLYESRK